MSKTLQQLDLVRDRTKKYIPCPVVNGALAMRGGIYLLQRNFFVLPSVKLIAWDDEGGVAELSRVFKIWSEAEVLDPLLDLMHLRLSDPAECLGGGRLGSVFKVQARDTLGP